MANRREFSNNGCFLSRWPHDRWKIAMSMEQVDSSHLIGLDKCRNQRSNRSRTLPRILETAYALRHNGATGGDTATQTSPLDSTHRIVVDTRSHKGLTVVERSSWTVVYIGGDFYEDDTTGAEIAGWMTLVDSAYPIQ